MSVDYYALFKPVHAKRSELVDPLTSILFDLEAIHETKFDQLTQTDDTFEYTFDRQHCTSLADAVAQSEDFGGLEYSFVIEDASCSFVIWNDQPDITTIAYCEPRRLFLTQLDSSDERALFFRLLMQIMDQIGSHFCVLEAEAEYKSLSVDDVFAWITEGRKTYPDKWRLVIVKDSAIPPSDLPEPFRTEHCWLHLEGFDGWLWSSMGAVEPQLLYE